MLPVLLFTGCPYDAETSLGAPVVGSLDARLLGQWTWTDTSTHAVTRFTITKHSTSEYAVETREQDNTVEQYRAHITSVGAEPFLNIRELKKAEAKSSFSFARYTLSDAGVLTLRFVGDKAVPKSLAADRAGLVKYLSTRLQGTVLDDPDGPFVMHRLAPAGAPRVRP